MLIHKNTYPIGIWTDEHGFQGILTGSGGKRRRRKHIARIRSTRRVSSKRTTKRPYEEDVLRTSLIENMANHPD